ncbi:hypothetical protein M514_14945 [Trichuris suis]|uniref:Uncharacterized protein n=1 Tax=Trichuris suis TaxID=68888 RepID=A0A085NU95_9BILA|nr:hypothetical protein M514_14945 [Trichuris suis]
MFHFHPSPKTKNGQEKPLLCRQTHNSGAKVFSEQAHRSSKFRRSKQLADPPMCLFAPCCHWQLNRANVNE